MGFSGSPHNELSPVVIHYLFAAIPLSNFLFTTLLRPSLVERKLVFPVVLEVGEGSIMTEEEQKK